MLLQTQHHVHLPQKHSKVLHICPAFNDTLMMLAIRHHRTQVLVHMDMKGKTIKEKVFYDSELQQMAMVNDRTVVVLHRKQNIILQWNVQTDTYMEIPHLFMSQQISEITYLYTYSQTKLICIVQLGCDTDNSFRLTYYMTPFVSDQDQAYTVFQSQQIWNHTHIVRKGNDHSMVCWAQIELQKYGELKLFDLKQSSCDGSCLVLQLEQAPQWRVFSEIQISIGNIWQIRPMQFLICGATNQNYQQSTNQYPNTLFVYCPQIPSFRYCNFSLPSSCHNQFIDSMRVGPFSIFRTYEFQKGQPLTTPIFYISNQTEQVLATEEWQCSHMYKYQTIPQLENGYVQCLFQNGHVEDIIVRVKEIPSTKVMYAFMLEEMVGRNQCQSDLVLQICRLIPQ